MDGEDEWNHLVHIGEGPEHPHAHRAHRDYDEGQRSRLAWEKGKFILLLNKELFNYFEDRVLDD